MRQNTSSGSDESVMMSAMSEFNVFDYAKMRCPDPPNLPMLGNGPDTPSVARQKLYDAVASPLRKTTPFLWLHYGDGDMMSMTGMRAGSLEGADLNSKCVREGLQDMFLGNGPKNLTSSALVYQSVGKFFMCQGGGIKQQMNSFMAQGKKAKFPFYNDFYFANGNITSSPKASWAVAAKERRRPVVIVGPKHLDGLHCMFNHTAFFEIPLPTRGCGDVDRLAPQLVEYSKTKFPNDSVLFVVAGGSIGKMIAYKAFQSLLDKDMFVDVGASLDGFAGRHSRGYNRPKRYCKPHYKQWMSQHACANTCGKINPHIKCCADPSSMLSPQDLAVEKTRMDAERERPQKLAAVKKVLRRKGQKKSRAFLTKKSTTEK
jgi:hypothetical protein